jgi:diacylglycerol kinase family enzyme
MASPSITLVLNPASGSGTHQPGIRWAARARQIDVREVSASRGAGALARQAVDQGAQVLVAAGGDGTLSAVAGVAVNHDVPLVIVPCGTRNHFAKDCGADITDPASQLTAIENGHEVRVDVGTVNDRVFLDNVSVGFYAEMVRDPEYRHRRIRVAARYAQRALLWGGRCASLRTSVPRRVVAPEQVLAVLVSNNAYSPGIAPKPALRPRLDEGMLWVYLLGLPGANCPLPGRLVRGTGRLISGRALVAAWPTSQQTMTTDIPSIPAGIDGEADELNTPLKFAARPRALRLLQLSRNDPMDRQFSLRW